MRGGAAQRGDAVTPLVALALSLAPALPLKMISQKDLIWTRDAWLLGVLGLGTVWLALHGELWLALIGLWFLCHWTASDVLGSLVNWVGIGVTWFLLQSLPRAVFDWLPYAWGLVVAWQVVLILRSLRRYGWHRPKGSLGSPAANAMLFALYYPLALTLPTYAMIPAIVMTFTGAAFTCSWLAFLAMGASTIWLWPQTSILVAAGGLLVGILRWRQPYLGKRRLFEYTPRGETLKPVWGRLNVWRIVPSQVTWAGHGPHSMNRALKEWKSRTGINATPDSDAHMELMQITYEYGVLGLLAAVAFLVHILNGARIGDTWSAAFIGGCVLSLGHWPARLPPVAIMWLTIAAGVWR